MSGKWMNIWKRRSTRRSARAELSRLDDRLLRDLGLERSDITTVVDGLMGNPAAGVHGVGSATVYSIGSAERTPATHVALRRRARAA